MNAAPENAIEFSTAIFIPPPLQPVLRLATPSNLRDDGLLSVAAESRSTPDGSGSLKGPHVKDCADMA